MRSHEAPCPCHGCELRRLGCRADCPRGWAEWEKAHKERRDELVKRRAAHADAKTAMVEGFRRVQERRRGR